MKNFFRNLGPGILVSAAFIGPGTVTVCSLAGVAYGYSLLWALLVSLIACIVLQEMSARLGLVTGKGLSDSIRQSITSPVFRIVALILIFSAIVIGNAAYEAGNISGAVMGVQSILPIEEISISGNVINLWSFIIGGSAFLLLYLGSYKKLEKVFIGLVVLMSLAFIITAFLTQPSWAGILQGFVPTSISDEILTIIALVGTTVVPYNLFLHASLVGEKWTGVKHLKTVQRELVFSIILGGLVSMAILICAASSGLSSIDDVAGLAVGLEPLFGSMATTFLAIGLLAAGITSSITAPLAAAYVVKGCLGWKAGMADWRFKAVWMSIIILGVFFSSLGIKPVEIIQFAQVANGIVLPVIAIFLLWIVNQESILGKFRNSAFQNIIGILVIALAIFLGAKSIYTVIQNL
ncbi:Nramp family divalent metal transporter [Christiangramia sp. OXR-203]|jgi:Mn2+/Fe2+ NRAMP family transporter|uniref:Nramp family divalent metal transporter n=1 Tax=Christiangramia sp. OXR-203 TaxID=3100176 RepID=UPI002AC8B21D|nr:Nramp family divalent metal transporter [Christiangramia sp. OXR-203]WPY99618.1 Nramp family divalent metal transporter [Christiangramia sp. OXR-203]